MDVPDSALRAPVITEAGTALAPETLRERIDHMSRRTDVLPLWPFVLVGTILVGVVVGWGVGHTRSLRGARHDGGATGRRETRVSLEPRADGGAKAVAGPPAGLRHGYGPMGIPTGTGQGTNSRLQDALPGAPAQSIGDPASDGRTRDTAERPAATASERLAILESEVAALRADLLRLATAHDGLVSRVGDIASAHDSLVSRVGDLASSHDSLVTTVNHNANVANLNNTRLR